MRCTEIVTQDHAILRRVLDILDGMLDKLERGERIEIADATTILEFIKLFAVEYHQRMEEDVLFPALLRTSPPTTSLADMLFAHAEQDTLIAAIDGALTAKKGADFVRNSRGLIALLKNHFAQEETMLAGIAMSSTLSDEEQAALVSKITDHRPEAYLNFSRMELKYDVERVRI
jgi:hemerythrin-like domain-containing protein